MMGEPTIRDSLGRIRTWLEREMPHLASALQTGLRLEEMQRIMGAKAAKYRIPGEVVELYAWRNGQAAQVPFFDYIRFQPFEDAVEYANLVEEYFDGTFNLMVFQELNYDAGYQIRCGPEEQQTSPAYRWIHGDERIETPTLADLLGAIAEAFEEGVFRPNDQGELDTDEEAWSAILVRHHTDRVRDVNLLRDRQWSELRGERLGDAIYDLYRFDKPNAIAVIREYLDSRPGLSFPDFEAIYAALSTGILLDDEWTRDFALRLIVNPDLRVRAAALTSLAWSWRGNLQLNAGQVDTLISQWDSRPVEDSSNRERCMLLGRSGEHRAGAALMRLLNEVSVDRDTAIAATRALGRLRIVEARGLCLSLARPEEDFGVRGTAVSALIEMGFEDDAVEAAAKTLLREMNHQFGRQSDQDDSSTLDRWTEEVRKTWQS